MRGISGIFAEGFWVIVGEEWSVYVPLAWRCIVVGERAPKRERTERDVRERAEKRRELLPLGLTGPRRRKSVRPSPPVVS